MMSLRFYACSAFPNFRRFPEIKWKVKDTNLIMLLYITVINYNYAIYILYSFIVIVQLFYKT